MNSIRAGAAAILLLIAASFPLPSEAGNFELTPFGGYTWGGQFTDTVTGAALQVNETKSYGVMLDFKQDPMTMFELYFSHQPTELRRTGLLAEDRQINLDIDYYHMGGTVQKGEGMVQPFMVGTVGVTYLDPKGVGTDSSTKFSFSLGGGAKILLTDHLGLRFEGRWFGTVFNGSGSALCGSNPSQNQGGCAIHVEGFLFSQFVANAGLILAF